MATNTFTTAQIGQQTPQLTLDKFINENWTQTETSNAKVVIDFVQHIMNEHDFDYIEQQFGKNPYVQHNRGMHDGIAGVVESVRGLTKRFPGFSYDVKRIHASGDYVILHSHVTTKEKHRGNEKKGFIISDTWRLENGILVEHWDAIQPLDGAMRFFAWMNGGKIRNSNGLF